MPPLEACPKPLAGWHTSFFSVSQHCVDFHLRGSRIWMKWYLHLSLLMGSSSLRGGISSIHFSQESIVRNEYSINGCWTEFEIFEAQSPWGHSVKSTSILRKTNYSFSWNQLPGREKTWVVLWRDGYTGFGLIRKVRDITRQNWWAKVRSLTWRIMQTQC